MASRLGNNPAPFQNPLKPKKLYLEDFYYSSKLSKIFPDADFSPHCRESSEVLAPKTAPDDSSSQFQLPIKQEFHKLDPDNVGYGEGSSASGSTSSCVESKLGPYVVKRRRKSDDSADKKYACTYCSFRTKYTKSLREHVLLHKSRDEVQMYQCSDCPYETKRKHYLRKHSLKHKTKGQTEMHKCPDCDFETKRKDGLLRHMLLIHDYTDGAMVYKCNECSYQTKLSYSLTSHLLTHQNDEELYKYKCNECPYKTKEKRALFKHSLSHKSKEEIHTYKCGFCPFETRRKSGLTKHVAPIPGDGVNTYKCTVCLFETMRKKCLRSHMLEHRDDQKAYKCPHCSYQHNKKKKLARHILVHSDAEESFKYRCTECPFKTKWVDALNTHRLRHVKDEDEGGFFRCMVCSYNARNKAHLTRHLKMHKRVAVDEQQ